jgi:hypothetical protein
MAKKGNGAGFLHEGLKTHSPPVQDKSRAPIGSKHPTVDREQPERVKLRVGWERFSDVIHEAKFLIQRQQAEVGENFEPFSPDWDLYFSYERSGSIAVWTARDLDQGSLVGYIVWLTTRGLHCANTLFASADLVYLAPEWREGITGYKFLKSGIEAVRSMVDVVRVETNDLYENGRMGLLLERLGFRRIGSVYQGHGR